MTVDERARHELHERLADALGPEPAGTLMSQLPPVGWADVATKSDLAALEDRVEATLHRELAGLQRELTTMQRTNLFGMFTLVLTVAVMAFGAAQLTG